MSNSLPCVLRSSRLKVSAYPVVEVLNALAPTMAVAAGARLTASEKAVDRTARLMFKPSWGR